MIRRPPRSTRTDTLFPYTTLFRSLAQFVTPTHRVAFIPNATDRSIENLECFARTDQAFDLLCAIGSESGAPWRGDAMRALTTAVPEGRYGFFGLNGSKPLFGAAYFRSDERRVGQECFGP